MRHILNPKPTISEIAILLLIYTNKCAFIYHISQFAATLHMTQTATTIDRIYQRLEALGVNIDAIKEVNLSFSQAEELCQRLEHLMHEK